MKDQTTWETSLQYRSFLTLWNLKRPGDSFVARSATPLFPRTAERVSGRGCRYRSIAPLVGKVEELVAASNSGRSPALADYYAHWERRIFAALNQAVAAGMAKLQHLVTGQPKKVRNDYAGATREHVQRKRTLVLRTAPCVPLNGCERFPNRGSSKQDGWKLTRRAASRHSPSCGCEQLWLLLTRSYCSGVQLSGGRPSPPVMLFKLTTSLSPPEILVQPAVSEVTKLLSRMVSRLVGSRRPWHQVLNPKRTAESSVVSVW